MNGNGSKRDMIYVDEDTHDIYKRLSEGSDPVMSPFQTMREAFIWAASMGFRLGEKRPIKGKRVGIIRWWQFKQNAEIPVLQAIAIADTGGVEVLSDHEKLLMIIEEYANNGIHSLQSNLLQSGQPLWNLVNLIQNNP